MEGVAMVRTDRSKAFGVAVVCIPFASVTACSSSGESKTEGESGGSGSGGAARSATQVHQVQAGVNSVFAKGFAEIQHVFDAMHLIGWPHYDMLFTLKAGIEKLAPLGDDGIPVVVHSS